MNRVYADNLNSPNFEVHMGTVNITGGSKSSASYKVSDTVGQTAQGQFDSTGYQVRAGFQYVRTSIPFSFTVDSFSVSLGALVPNTFSTATNTLTVTAGGAYGYAVKAIENRSLTINGTSTTIPDSVCNAGTPCTITDANVWNSTTAYGFGYNMSGNDVDTGDFVNSTYYRPFPNNSLAESPVTIMSKASVTASSIATVTYKANVSPTQTGGTYENAIQYLAIPAY